jgi:hypothetical protein
MGKRPSFQFYPRDWLGDPAVRSVSRAARGMWIDMLCLMFESDRKGYLMLSGKPATLEQIACMTGCPADEASRLVSELEASGVFSRADDGAIFNRRMARDHHLHHVRSAAGKLGAPHGVKGGRPRKTAKTANDNGKPQKTETANTPFAVSENTPFSSGNKRQKGQNNPPSSSSSTSVLTPLPPKGGCDARFDQFWKSYPKKAAKGAARKVWARLRPSAELLASMLAAIERQRQCEQWRRERGRFIPHPATWLGQSRWEDEVAGPAPAEAPEDRARRAEALRRQCRPEGTLPPEHVRAAISGALGRLRANGSAEEEAT